jgi:hypothetical protein
LAKSNLLYRLKEGRLEAGGTIAVTSTITTPMTLSPPVTLALLAGWTGPASTD